MEAGRLAVEGILLDADWNGGSRNARSFVCHCDSTSSNAEVCGRVPQRRYKYLRRTPLQQLLGLLSHLADLHLCLSLIDLWL